LTLWAFSFIFTQRCLATIRKLSLHCRTVEILQQISTTGGTSQVIFILCLSTSGSHLLPCI
jgi:hypothetical protein